MVLAQMAQRISGRFHQRFALRLLVLVLASGTAISAVPEIATELALEPSMLTGDVAELAPTAVAARSRTEQLPKLVLRAARRSGTVFWLTSQLPAAAAKIADPALLIEKGRHLAVDLYLLRDGAAKAILPATALPGFFGMHTAVYALPDPLRAGDQMIARVTATGRGAEDLQLRVAGLADTLALGATHARTITLAFGALAAMSLGALVIWLVLKERIFLLYCALFTLQALYILFLSGQGFDWPVLAAAVPLGAHTWNVPAALSGAAACWFVREIADLRRFSPRVYRMFGWLAWVFIALALANFAGAFGLGGVIAAIGNLVFLATAVFTLAVAFLAWRRGNRAAGWFLIAWALLEAATIASAVVLLVADGSSAEQLFYYGMPISMVLAAILVALGVADRLREQRLALSDAERRAQTDPLTGVLNRASLLERLDAACARARNRDLPIAILFIDLDHFKEINDSFGHRAGDACLRSIIGPIQAELRQSDVIGRYGGEEFVVLLSSATAGAAYPIAERIRERVATTQITGFGKPIQVTCSIGVAASDTLGLMGEELIERADAAVYAAKWSGRNCVQVAMPLAA
ncbi:MAG: diguanylate cyclase [Steroidobacteraceae bacterium]